jgi:ethanolamine ammonia-lyase small subunit
MSDWESLKKYTQARIGLGRVGYAVSTKEHLKFQFDHARARDAVHWPWEIEKFQKKLKSAKIPSQVLKTRITSRQEYLTRPDLGKLLGPNKLKPVRADIAIVVSNGLSSSAVENHGVLFLKRLWNQLESEFKLAPVCLVENARVALSDEIGSKLKAKMVLMIIGERPGLTSFDSLALYLTYAPKLGNSDAQRNCISNIRPPDGLSYETAVKKTLFLVSEAFRRKISGVELKEEADLVNIRQNSDGGQLT